MKVCPKCNQTYDDNNLNFCLNDGELLMEQQTQDAPPTIMMDAPRQTNENWGEYNQAYSQPSNQQNQMYQPPFASPQNFPSTAGKDQTLAIVAIISGALSVILSWCCYMGIFIGPIALITGFLAMNNVNKNPDQYDGKGLAIAGMVAGGVGMAVSIIMLVIVFLAQLL
jgi:hypothetical protein